MYVRILYMPFPEVSSSCGCRCGCGCRESSLDSSLNSPRHSTPFACLSLVPCCSGCCDCACGATRHRVLPVHTDTQTHRYTACRPVARHVVREQTVLLRELRPASSLGAAPYVDSLYPGLAMLGTRPNGFIGAIPTTLYSSVPFPSFGACIYAWINVHGSFVLQGMDNDMAVAVADGLQQSCGLAQLISIVR